MNTKRVLFWLGFIIVLGLIVWGLVVSMNKRTGGAGPTSPAAVTSADHVLGSANAPVTLIEYSDFQCPACEEYYPLVTRLYNESSTTMRLVYRHFPLSQHPNAIPAAIASEAASVQGKFWPMYNELFSNHADWTELADPTTVFLGYAAKIGLDINEFKADLASSTLRDIVMADQNEGTSIGIDQTPTFFINGKVISNPQNYDQFKSFIEVAASSSSR